MNAKRTRGSVKVVKITKPQLKTVQAIIEKKEQAIALLNEVEALTSELEQKYGEVRFDYDLGEENDKGQRYLKFEIVDNIEKLNRGEQVFQQTVFKRTTFTSSMLKRLPESLK